MPPTQITGPAAKLPSVHAAAACGNIGVLRLLLQCNVSLVHLKAVTGRTPCHVAAESGQAMAVRVLVECGALLTVADDAHLYPAQLAAVNGHLGLSRYLTDLQTQEDHGNISAQRGRGRGRSSSKWLFPLSLLSCFSRFDPSTYNLPHM